MSAFLRLNTQDAFVAPYVAHKLYNFQTSSDFQAAGIDRFYSDISVTSTIGDISSYKSNLVYKTINHLYYSTFSDADAQEGAYEHYTQSSLSPKRTLGTEFALITIPKEVYGEAIQPGTLRLEDSGDVITDDGEGVLYVDGNICGNVIYSHGMIIITEEQDFSAASFTSLTSSSTIEISFRNTYTIYEHQYRCKVNQSQLNFTQNPSSHTDGVISADLTGNEFQPYITAVGLYNDANELVAVGKLSMPIPKSQYNDMTFVVKFDA